MQSTNNRQKLKKSEGEKEEQGNIQPFHMAFALGGILVGGVLGLLGASLFEEPSKPVKETAKTSTEQVQYEKYLKDIPQEQLVELLECQITSQQIVHAAQLKTCGHTFEQKAIEEWIRMRQNCPVCRVQAEMNDIVKNQPLQNIIEQANKYRKP